MSPVATLRDIMSSPVVTVSPDDDLAHAARLMLDRGIGSLVVVDADGKLTGILSDSDFCARQAPIPFSTLRFPKVLGYWLGQDGLERVYREARSWKVSQVMTRRVRSVDRSGTLEEALRIMLDHRVKHVPVMEEGRPVGMVARSDLLKLLLDVHA